MTETTFQLEPTPPFRLDLTVWVLRRRPDNTIDYWDGETYRRVLSLDGEPVDVMVTQRGTPEAPQLVIMARTERPVPKIECRTRRAITHMLGLNVDLTGFYDLAASDAVLGPLAEQFRGFKPTRYLSMFECLANAIICQQVTLVFGLRVVSRLAEQYGPLGPDGTLHAFPRPQDIVGATPEALREIGFSRQKARALLEIAEGITQGTLNLEELDRLDNGDALIQLTTLRGVGRWTAEYSLLRGLGRLDVFPGDDVGVRKGLRRWLDLPEKLDYDGIQERLSRWDRYRGLLYFHMLLLNLAESGRLDGQA